MSTRGRADAAREEKDSSGRRTRRAAALCFAALLAAAGCAATAGDAQRRWHPPGFAPVTGMPALPIGVHRPPGLEVVVVDALPHVQRRGGAAVYGYYAGRRVVTVGDPDVLGHEVRHYCDDVGAAACAPAVDWLRAIGDPGP